jgi:hypothetical protein
MSRSLLALEDSGIARIDGEDPVGAKCRCHLFFFARADQFAESAARPIQPRTHRADRNVERGRRVLGTGPALELVKEELADPTASHSHPHDDRGVTRRRH